MRFANLGVGNGDEVNVFMLGKGVMFEQVFSEGFNVMEQIKGFQGDFYVLIVYNKVRDLAAFASCFAA